MFQVSDKVLVNSQAFEHKGASKGMTLSEVHGNHLILSFEMDFQWIDVIQICGSWMDHGIIQHFFTMIDNLMG